MKKDWQDKFWEEMQRDWPYARHIPEIKDAFEYLRDNVINPLLEGNQEAVGWISAEIKPVYNMGVLVFIPDEDYHITSGMWDISDKWVLLDEYRVPECEVTHWMKIPDVPKQFKKEIKENYEVLKGLSQLIKEGKKAKLQINNKDFDIWLETNYTESDFPGFFIDRDNWIDKEKPMYRLEDLKKIFSQRSER